MSLYYDAATVLTTSAHNGSLKSRIYGNKLGLRSKPAHIYALISETAKYDGLLKEIIENTGLLAHEAKLTPILSLLLVHDHFFSKRGIAAPSAHPLRQAIERHKARLQSELTKARLRRRCLSLEELKRYLLAEKPSTLRSHPRWIRVNTLKSSLEQELATTFKDYKSDASVLEVANSSAPEKLLAIDPNVPDLIALAPEADVTKSQSYKDGKLILQDKASCFPAYMLVGEQEDASDIGDCVDGCSAPGNKTSHLAALLANIEKSKSKVYACERDRSRSVILKTMMERSGARSVIVRAECDFLTVDPREKQYDNVTHLLLDPSCSGSGIVGREDIPSLELPDDPRGKNEPTKEAPKHSKKRKRGDDSQKEVKVVIEEASEVEETREVVVNSDRLLKLSNLQARIVEHALSFPAAVRVTYSTCSIHVEENEAVVARVLRSTIARERGWRMLQRKEQVSGLCSWPHRGVSKSQGYHDLATLQDEDLEACIRCNPGDSEGTMGFFVSCFVRSEPAKNGAEAEDIWDGFDD